MKNKHQDFIDWVIVAIGFLIVIMLGILSVPKVPSVDEFGKMLEERQELVASQTSDVVVVDETTATTLTQYEQAFYDIWTICEQEGLPFKPVWAICRLESGNFKHIESNYNYCGITINGNVMSYQDKEQGLKAMTSTMDLYRTELWNNDIKGMSSRYCPPNAENWTNAVISIMNEKECIR